MTTLRAGRMPEDWIAIHPRLSPAQPELPPDDSFAEELASLGEAWTIEDNGEIAAIGGRFASNGLLWGALASNAPIARIVPIAARMIQGMPECRALVRLDFRAGHRFAQSIGLRPVGAIHAEGTTAMMYEGGVCYR
jgi:hypothetical protein